MESYGFILLKRDEAKQIGIPDGSGMFVELRNMMMNEASRFPDKAEKNYGSALNMTNYEKEISDLNRYFIYKKISTVNAEKIANNFISKLPNELQYEEVVTQHTQNVVEKIQTEKKTKTKALKTKIVLSGDEEVTVVAPIAAVVKTKKTATRKKKVEFEIA